MASFCVSQIEGTPGIQKGTWRRGRSYMAIQIGQRKTRVVIAFVLGVAPAVSFAQSQSFANQPPAEAAPSSYTAPMGLTGDDIIGKMLERNRLRNKQLQRYSAVRTYEIRNLEGKLAAQAVVRVDYEEPDKKTFSKTSEKGSWIVRHLLFDRLMQSESETSGRREHHNSPSTTTNYTFLLNGEEE